ncbi:MAG: membrane protein insertion efficiency factor YidD [Myxococcota bacterium]
MNPAVRLLVLFVRAYQWFISPIFMVLGAQCRFEPTCSAYAIGALQKYGVLSGSRRAAQRILRCHPFHPGGIDPP